MTYYYITRQRNLIVVKNHHYNLLTRITGKWSTWDKIHATDWKNYLYNRYKIEEITEKYVKLHYSLDNIPGV